MTRKGHDLITDELVFTKGKTQKTGNFIVFFEIIISSSVIRSGPFRVMFLLYAHKHNAIGLGSSSQLIGPGQKINWEPGFGDWTILKPGSQLICVYFFGRGSSIKKNK